MPSHVCFRDDPPLSRPKSNSKVSFSNPQFVVPRRVAILLFTQRWRRLQARKDHDVRLEQEVQEAEGTAAAGDAVRVARDRAAWQANAECGLLPPFTVFTSTATFTAFYCLYM